MKNKSGLKKSIISIKHSLNHCLFFGRFLNSKKTILVKIENSIRGLNE